MDTEDCGRKRLLKYLIKESWNQSTVHPLSITPLPGQPEDAKRGRRILRGQSYKRINNEILLRLLTDLARKIGLKISLTGDP